ncbi:MAG: hypothetical protein ACLSDQ_11835 [Adlercreutzia equolifaciens]
MQHQVRVVRSQRTHASRRRAGSRRFASSSAGRDRVSQAPTSARRIAQRRRRSCASLGLPAAACFVAAAIVAGGVPMVMGAMDADGHTAIS